MPVPSSLIPNEKPFQKNLGRNLLILDRNNRSIRQSRCHLPDRQVTIEGEKGATGEARAELDDRGRFLPSHAVDREVTIRATDQAKRRVGAARLEMARPVTSEAGERRGVVMGRRGRAGLRKRRRRRKDPIPHPRKRGRPRGRTGRPTRRPREGPRRRTRTSTNPNGARRRRSRKT